MWKIVTLFILTVCFNGIIGRSVDAPEKFSLETNPQNLTDVNESNLTQLQQGKELLGRIMDGIRFSRGRIVNMISLAKNIVANRAEEIASDTKNNVASVVAAKKEILNQKRDTFESHASVPQSSSSGRETVHLENEGAQGFLERQFPNPVGKLLENFVKAEPLIDRIKEEEKYGNSGDKFIGIGRALVGGFEGLSNFLNSLVDFPVNAAKKTSRGLTEALNHVGARLVGLE